MVCHNTFYIIQHCAMFPLFQTAILSRNRPHIYSQTFLHSTLASSSPYSNFRPLRVVFILCEATKSDHSHPILQTLHWLPATHRIQYKISTICFNSISGTAPHYMSDLLQPYTPARQLRSASDAGTFFIPCANTKTFDERSFPYTGSSV